MAYLSVWTLSVAGIVVLAQLVDIILPEGQTAKYIKSVISVIIVFVLLQPISALSNLKLFEDTDQTYVNQAYLDDIYVKQVAQIEENVNSVLADNGINVTAQVICSRLDNLPRIDFIIVNISQSVIESSDALIEYKEKIITTLSGNLNVEEAKIWFYES